MQILLTEEEYNELKSRPDRATQDAWTERMRRFDCWQQAVREEPKETADRIWDRANDLYAKKYPASPPEAPS